MKKKILAMMVCMMSVVMLMACGTSENTVSREDADNSTVENEAEGTDLAAGYAFEVSGVSLMPDMDIDSVLSQLGEPETTFESESCAKQGKAYLYTFSDYEVETYPDGETNRVYYISLLNDNVATAEGVDLSYTKDQVIEVYGEPTETKENTLIYKKDGSESKLKFIFESDENMISIEYDSKEM